MSERNAEFAERLGRHQTQLFGYIYSLVRDFNEADELFQQTSLVLWEKFDTYDRTRSFIAWACGVARIEVSNFLRARSRERLFFSDGLGFLLIDAHEEFERERERREEHHAALAECMQKLRVRDQELLEDCYGQQLRIPEVARARGRSTHSLHNSLRRIRRSLFVCIRRVLEQGGVA